MSSTDRRTLHTSLVKPANTQARHSQGKNTTETDQTAFPEIQPIFGEIQPKTGRSEKRTLGSDKRSELANQWINLSTGLYTTLRVSSLCQVQPFWAVHVNLA